MNVQTLKRPEEGLSVQNASNPLPRRQQYTSQTVAWVRHHGSGELHYELSAWIDCAP